MGDLSHAADTTQRHHAHLIFGHAHSLGSISNLCNGLVPSPLHMIQLHKRLQFAPANM
jgi:hypothetical protein